MRKVSYPLGITFGAIVVVRSVTTGRELDTEEDFP
jgi:hypothetical protein